MAQPQQCPVDEGKEKEMAAQCPVPHQQRQQQEESSRELSPLMAWILAGVRDNKSGPIVGINPDNNMPAVPQQGKWPGQRFDLPTIRVVSSIPKGDFTPPHQLLPGQQQQQQQEQQDQQKMQQQQAAANSEQQFFNAMKKKGWKPEERDMGIVVAIHNAVNERTWQHVLQWEQMHCNEQCPKEALKLVRFKGRPKDPSPKSLFLNLIGYTKPFDRHDWTVDRCGKEVRYVIDFYNGNLPSKDAPASIFLDVRPAIDTIESFVDRARVSLFGFSTPLNNSTTTPSPKPEQQQQQQ